MVTMIMAISCASDAITDALLALRQPLASHAIPQRETPLLCRIVYVSLDFGTMESAVHVNHAWLSVRHVLMVTDAQIVPQTKC